MSQDLYRSGEYARLNPSYHVEDSAWKAHYIVQMLEQHKLTPRSICEIGCGAGEILKQLQSRLPEDAFFCGYEISPQGYALCQPRANERLRFFNEDLLQLTNLDTFDVVLCIDVFEHVEDYLGFLKRLRGYGRYTLFHIPLDLSVQSLLRVHPILFARSQVGHLHYFTKEIALSSLHDCGYEIIGYFYTPVGLETRHTTSARLAKLPRYALSSLSADWAARLLGGYSLMVLAHNGQDVASAG
ncbi:MAG: methylase [Chloroflexi bacterium]|nr:MAG: methylase [Chloroflexota bacterium]